mgnify:CR=1 FL=1
MPKSEHLMVFLPPEARRYRPELKAYCHWCVETKPKRALFKVREGPIDRHFCDVMHAELWLQYRHTEKAHKLCRMPPKERREYLNGRTMEDEISRLFPEGCDTSQ